jgi:hypothetical protein
MFLLSVLVAAALAWAGLRYRAVLPLQWLLVVLAWMLAAERLYRLTLLPPPARESQDFDIQGQVRPLVVTRTDLLAYGEEVILRARLPSLTERVVLPAGRRMTVMVSVASLGQSVAWTYHDGPEDWGWAMLGPMGWLVPPQHLFDQSAENDANARGERETSRQGAYVIEDRGELLLVTMLSRKGGYSLEIQQIAADGTLSAPELVPIDGMWPVMRSICRVGGRWYLPSRGEAPCELVDGRCVEVADFPGCPNDLLGYSLRRDGEWVAADPWVRAAGSSSHVRKSWHTGERRLEEAGDGTFLERRWVDWPEAQAQGLLPRTHTRVVRVNKELQELSPPGWVQGADVMAFLVDTDVEVVLVGHDGSAQARFDRRTFERLDTLPPVDAIWAQLEQTGGAQPLLSVLGISLLGLGLVPFGLRELREGRAPLSLQLASGAWVLLTLPATMALVSRWS